MSSRLPNEILEPGQDAMIYDACGVCFSCAGSGKVTKVKRDRYTLNWYPCEFCNKTGTDPLPWTELGLNDRS